MEKQKKKTQWIRIDAHSVRTLRQPTKQEKKLNRTTWKGLPYQTAQLVLVFSRMITKKGDIYFYRSRPISKNQAMFLIRRASQTIDVMRRSDLDEKKGQTK